MQIKEIFFFKKTLFGFFILRFRFLHYNKTFFKKNL